MLTTAEYTRGSMSVHGGLYHLLPRHSSLLSRLDTPGLPRLAAFGGIALFGTHEWAVKQVYPAVGVTPTFLAAEHPRIARQTRRFDTRHWPSQSLCQIESAQAFGDVVVQHTFIFTGILPVFCQKM